MRATQVSISPDRWRSTIPFIVIGSACVVVGGIIAAVTAHDPSELATWSVAYLVLVGGVAQLALALGQAVFAPAAPSRRVIAGEFITWNVGNAAVLIGTLLDVLILTDVGGALLVVALALLVRSTHRARATLPLQVYRLIIVIVLVSIPIGLVLARM